MKETSTQALKEALELLKQLENQTIKSNKSLEIYTKNWNSLNSKIHNINSNNNSNKINNTTNTTNTNIANVKTAALQYAHNKGISTLAYSGGKTGAAISNEISTLGKGVSELSASAGAAVGVVGAVALGLTAMATAGAKAAKTNSEVARGLYALGEQQSKYTYDAISASNSMNKLKNSWSNTVISIQQTFTPFFNWLAEVGTSLLGLVGSSSEINYSQSTIIRGNIATSARNQGFSTYSARNLSNGIYNMALQLSEKYGVDSDTIASELEESIFSGSDAASKYNLFNNEHILTGYMQSKGLDRIYTSISEAEESYQRFLLLQEQLNGKVGEEAVNSFQKLGAEIQKTKQQLFSFDEVLSLQAYNSSIPEVGEIPLLIKEKNDNQNSLLNDSKHNLIGLNAVALETKKIYETVSEKLKAINSEAYNALPNEVKHWVEELLRVLNGLEVQIGVALPEEEKEKVQAELNSLKATVPVEIGIVDGEKEKVQEELNSLNLGRININGLNELYDLLNKLNSTSFSIYSIFGDAEKEFRKDLSLLSSHMASINSPMSKQVISTVNTNLNSSELENALNSLNNQIKEVKESNIKSQSEGIASALGKVINERNLVYTLDETSKNTFNQIIREAEFLSSKLKENSENLTVTNNQINTLNSFYTYLKQVSNNSNSPYLTNNGSSKFLNEVYGSSFTQGLNVDNNKNSLYSTNTEKFSDKFIIGANNIKKSVGEFFNSGSTQEKNINSNVLGASVGGDFVGGLLGYGASNLIFSLPIPMFANGGINLGETIAHISEGNHAEAIIPLETESGIEYLSNAMKKANSDNYNNSSSTVNVSIPGNLFINSESQLNRLAEVIASKIAIQNYRRGSLE